MRTSLRSLRISEAESFFESHLAHGRWRAIAGTYYSSARCQIGLFTIKGALSVQDQRDWIDLSYTTHNTVYQRGCLSSAKCRRTEFPSLHQSYHVIIPGPAFESFYQFRK